MVHKIQNHASGKTHAALQVLLLVLLAVMPFAYVGVQAGYIPGYETIYTVPHFYPFEVGVLVAFVLWAAVRRPALADVRWFWPLGILVALGFLSAAWAPLPTLAIVISAHLAVAVLLLVILAREFREPPFLKAALAVLVTGAVVQAVWGIAQYTLQHDLGWQALGELVLRADDPNVARVPGESGLRIRAYGGLPHANVLAAYLSAGLFLLGAASFARRCRAWPRQMLLGAVFGVLGIAFLYTFSRTPWLAVAVGMGGLVAAGAYWHRRVPVGLLIGGLLVATAAFGAQQSITARSNPTNLNTVAVPDRLLQHQVAFGLLRERPYGTGAGNYSPAADRLRPELSGYQLQPVHNTVALITTELGIAGGLLVAVFIFRLLRRLRIREFWRHPDVLTAASGCFLLAAAGMTLTDHFFWTLPQGIWLLAVMLGLFVSRLPLKNLR